MICSFKSKPSTFCVSGIDASKTGEASIFKISQFWIFSSVLLSEELLSSACEDPIRCEGTPRELENRNIYIYLNIVEVISNVWIFFRFNIKYLMKIIEK